MSKLKGILLLQDSESWFYITIFFLPFLAVSPWQPLFIFPIHSGFVYAVLALLTFISFIRERLIQKKPISLWHPLFSILLLFVYVNIVSLAFNWDLIKLDPVVKNAVGFKSPYVYNIFLIIYLSFNFMTLWLAFNIVNSKEKLKKTFQVLIFSAIIACLYGTVLVLAHMLGYIKELLGPTWIVPRLHGTASEAQVFANFLLSILPFVFMMFILRVDILRRDILGIAIFIFLLSMVMTFSMGGWIGFIAGAGIGALLCIDRIKFERVLGVFLIFILILTTLFLIDYYLHRGYMKGLSEITLKVTGKVTPREKGEELPSEPRMDMTTLSKYDRMWLRQAALSMFWQHPVIGVGTGNYGFLYNYYKPGGTAGRPYLAKAHNAYLEILAETGFIGFSIFMIFLSGVLFKMGRVFFVSREGESRAYIAGIGASVIGLLVQGLVFGILVHNYTWIIFGLGLASARIFEENSKFA